MNKIKKNNIHYLLKTSFELANESIFLINKKGKLIFVNSTGCNHLLYSRKEILKLKVWDLDVLVNTKEKFIEKFNEVFNQGNNKTTILQSFFKRKDNVNIPVEISLKLIEVNGSPHIISYVSDISEKIKKDEKIKLYFEFIKGSSDIIFLIDYKTQLIEFANEKACASLNYTLEELKSKEISDVRKTFEDQLSMSQVFEKIKEEKTLSTIGQYQRRDGSFFTVETSLSIKNYQGNDFVMAISRNISDRIELDRKREDINAKLANYNKTLEQEVLKVKKELIEYENIMQRQAKLAAMGEMLENIAHQWRQPLSVISVLSTGMKLQNEAGILSTNELNEGLEDINVSSQYLSKTIEDFRDFFKPHNKKTQFPIREVIDYTVQLAKTKFTATGINLIENIQSIEIETFKNELIQVLINLINNAGDELEKSTKRRKLIFIECYESQSNVIIEIKDNAGGIPESIINRIFEPYFTTKHKSQGTGIGLYMSDEIIKKHMRGHIMVQNKEFMYEESLYKGAQFLIKLPKI